MIRNRRVRPYVLALMAGFLAVLGIWSLVLRVENATASTAMQTAPATPEPVAPAPTVSPADAFDGPGLGFDLLIKLGAVLGLAYVSLALLKRYTYGNAGRQHGNALKVVESTVLAPNRAVYLVRAGNREVLLGVTPTQISALSEWQADDTGTPATVPAAVRDHIANLPR